MLNSLQLEKHPSETTVVVAMSGGVDSSVVAALLHDEGYKVIGVTLQLYDHGAAIHRKGACCAGQDIYDAKTVADKMGFAHYVLNYEERFKKSVIDPFAQSYIEGETPLPCAACNQSVKFKDLLEVAKDLGADVLATGHYVQTQLMPNGQFAMFRPHDLDRDQSYFLYGTTPEQLSYVRFPLGGMPKSQVRVLADKFGLEIADKPDSQDICFVPSGHYSAIVEKLRPEASEPGDIVHMDGRVMGQHKGILHYTIGQRKGLGLALGEPVYVVSLDAKQHRVVVGPREALAMRDFVLRDVNWLGDEPLSAYGDDGLEIMVRVRSTRPPKPARIFDHPLGARISLSVDEEGVAPGQAGVFYADDSDHARVLGGGIITKTPSAQTVSSAA